MMTGLNRCWLCVVVAAVLLGGTGFPAAAQIARSAQLAQMTGRVEVQRKGQGDWVTAAVGDKLSEGDQIRAHAGASARLALPDGSALLLAENSRLAVTKLEVDENDQTRTGAFYLAVGKVRALVSKASISLIRSRQSNFVITTPTAVAAARGTHYEVTFDGTKKETRVAVLPDPRGGPEGASLDSEGGVHALQAGPVEQR